MARKIKKKDIKKLDEFQSTFEKIIIYMSENKSKIFLISGILVFFILSISGWHLYRLNYEKNALKMHSLAFNSYYEDNNRKAYINAIKLYRELVKKYPDSNAAIHALYNMGNIYFNINEIDKSISAYEKFIKKSSGDNDLIVLAYVGLGYCYEAKGNLKKALKSLDNSIKYCTVGSSYEGIIYRNMGRIYEEMNNAPKAVEYYEKALKLTIDPSMEMLIKNKISTLG